MKRCPSSAQSNAFGMGNALRGWLLAGMALWGLLGLASADAATIYSYLDDSGTLVTTEHPETIPERYRARVQIHEQPMPNEPPLSAGQSIERKLRTQLRDVRSLAPSFETGMYGLTPYQSEIVTYAGAVAVALLLMMYLSTSSYTRLLGLVLFVLLAICTPILVYVGDDGPVVHTQKKTAKAESIRPSQLQPPAR